MNFYLKSNNNNKMPKPLTQNILDKLYEAHDLKMSVNEAANYTGVSGITIKKYWEKRGLEVYFERDRTSKKNNETDQNKMADGYNFNKPLRRITLEKQIPNLFDSYDRKPGINRVYKGKIDGIEAKIIFSYESSYIPIKN